MVEILPIKAVHNEDLPIFGGEAVLLSKLAHVGLPVCSGIVITPPIVKLKTTLEHWDFGNREVIEQKLVILKKEIQKWPIPEILVKDTKGKGQFFVDGKCIRSVKGLWLTLLENWLDLLRQKIYLEGFNQPVTEALKPQIIFFIKGNQPTVLDGYKEEIKKLSVKANNILIIPHEFSWIVDDGVKLVGVEQYIQEPVVPEKAEDILGSWIPVQDWDDTKITVKLFYDLTSAGLVIDHSVDGIFLDSGKIDDFEELLFKLIESAATFRFSPILFKLADYFDKWGGVRGSLRLIHQKGLLDKLCDSVLYARNKRGFKNIHLVIPYVRGLSEFSQIKRELASKKLIRKNSLNIWLEVDLPENLLNLEDYLESGLDGVIINLDELSSHLLGFDYANEEVAAYKTEITGILNFLERGVRVLQKVNKPFLVMGKFALEPEVLHFLVDKGLYGLVLPKYEINGARELLHNVEKKVILSRST